MGDIAAMTDTDSVLMAYTTVLVKAIAARVKEERELLEKVTSVTDADDTMFGSMVVTLLFVPFSIYCGIVFFIFGVECYQFFAVWNLVSRTRTQNGVNMETLARQNQTHYTEDLQRQAQDQEKRNEQIQQRLVVRDYCREESKSWCAKTRNCTICLSDFVDGDKVASIRDCSCCKKSGAESQSTCNNSNPHQFHAPCLTQWLEESPSCPYCRDVLVPPLEQEQIFRRGTMQLSESLELASLEVEHYMFNALTIFGGLVASYTY